MPKRIRPWWTRKQTCSGWRQGFERGQAEAQAEIAKLKAQLKEHNDELCEHLTIAYISGAEHAKDEIARLKNVNEMLNREYADACKHYEERDLEIARLKAPVREQIEKLRALVLERDKEIKRDDFKVIDALLNEMDAITECERLRAALDKITKFYITSDEVRYGKFIDASAVDIARAALKGE